MLSYSCRRFLLRKKYQANTRRPALHGGTHYSFPVKSNDSWLSLQLFTPRAIAFFCGALMALTESSWNNRNAKEFLFISGIVLLYVLKGSYKLRVLGNLIIPTLVIIIGVSLTDKLIYSRFDYSYGVYVYALPVQQIVINHT